MDLQSLKRSIKRIISKISDSNQQFKHKKRLDTTNHEIVVNECPTGMDRFDPQEHAG